MFSSSLSTSPADDAFLAFLRLREEANLFSYDSPDLTEADTRSKLIDPIFKVVLGWNEPEIRREEPAGPGFTDYVFGAEFSYFHVEAKRVQPRFKLQVPSRARVLKLSGPHLLSNKDMAPVLKQAAGYSVELGTDFAIATNGSQFVVFRTRVPGRSWKSETALVWHDLKDIESDFAAFYALLSRDRVRAGSLIEAFEASSAITTPHHAPIDFIHNPDAELVRNRYWGRISKTFSPILTDDPTNLLLQEEIIRHCYVNSRLSDQTDSSLDALLRDKPSPLLESAGAVDLQQGMGGTGFDQAIEGDIKEGKAVTYVLTGGVGSGKTTYLRRFARVVQRKFVQEWCVWLHIDYLPAGGVARADLSASVSAYTYARLREELNTHYAELLPNSGEELRDLFAAQIDDARRTDLFRVPEDSDDWNLRVNQIVGALFREDGTTVRAMLTRLRARGRRAVLVLDNTDQLGEEFQETVFLLAQRLSVELEAFTIVALREEKFFAAYRRGVFDAFGDRRFHIGSPDLGNVISRRLFYGLDKLRDEESSAFVAALSTHEREQVEKLIRSFIQSTTKDNTNIVRMLSCISNGDMRHALAMFRAFVSSGNTDVDKILRVISDSGGYTVPFHEFAKSAILDLRRYYRGSLSYVVNLFQRSAARSASHLTACRILARLDSASGSASKHGEGFVDTSQLLTEFRQSFGVAEDFVQKAGELLRHDLLESEPPKAQDIEATDALRVCAAGAYYWRYLVRSFAYVDLVYVDTPIAEKELARELGRLSPDTLLTTRFSRVEKFLSYLRSVEDAELEATIARDGPFRASLVADIQAQIGAEVDSIRQRLHL